MRTARSVSFPGQGVRTNRSVARTLEVMELFARRREPLSIRQIAERCKFPLSSAQSVVKTLAALGYVSYNFTERTYVPTLRVAALGEWLKEFSSSDSDIADLLDGLSRITAETIVLAVQNDIFAQYIRVVPSAQRIQVFIPVGNRVLLCKSGAGWALLSSHSESTIRKIYSRTASRMGRAFMDTSIGTVLAQIEDTRERGYAFSKGSVTPGGGMIAMPLPADGTQSRLVIGVAGPLDRLVENEALIARGLKSEITKYRRSGAT